MVWQNGSTALSWSKLVQCCSTLISHKICGNTQPSQPITFVTFLPPDLEPRPPTSYGLDELLIILICVFGCAAYVHRPSATRSKLQHQSTLMTFIGYAPTRGGYQFLDQDRRQVVYSNHAKFIETRSITDLIPQTDQNTVTTFIEPPIETPDEPVVASVEEDTSDDSSQIELSDNEILPQPAVQETLDTSKSLYRQIEQLEKGATLPKRKRTTVTPFNLQSTVPSTWNQAMTGPDRHLWEAAWQEEHESLLSNHVYDETDLPRNHKPVGSRIIFAVKPDGRYKIRFCAKGYSQRPGIDYNETSSPVASQVANRILLTIAAYRGWEARHVDVKTAFLNGPLEEEIYLQPPPHLSKPGKVWKLNKALYGLKQAGRMWYQFMYPALLKLGWTQSSKDVCVFYKGSDPQTRNYISVHVDDFLVIMPNEEEATQFVQSLNSFYVSKDLGTVKLHLGANIILDKMRRSVIIHQTDMVNDILIEHGMDYSKPVSTPSDPSVKLTSADCSIDTPVNYPYSSVVGKLNYLATMTRPDIASAVSEVARYMSNPGPSHVQAVKRILRYLNGTKHHQLILQPKDLILTGYCDADWAGDVDTRRSTTGYCFFLGGALIQWRSGIQNVVARSTMEAEYRAIAECTSDLMWLRQFLDELGLHQTHPTTIYEDNQASIAYANSDTLVRGRAKHIEINVHVVRDLIKAGELTLQYCPTNDMKADILTKALGKIKHSHQCELLQLVPPSGGGMY